MNRLSQFLRRPLLAALVALGTPTHAFAWSHQGHILITRLAALRIIDDPAADPALKAFLKKNMPFTAADCETLATAQTLGTPQDPKGLDNWSTMPDRIQSLDEGKANIEPFGAPEPKMHFMDLEYFSKDSTYKSDLSNLPAVDDVPEDPHDARYKMAGFSPLRAQQCYDNLVRHFKADVSQEPQPDPGNPAPDTAARWAGSLAHYLEDETQPHHSTIDYKSYSYLAGHVAGVRSKTTDTARGPLVTYFSTSKTVNPHGDLEYQLFENADEPRKSLRQHFWTQLNTDLATLAKKTTSFPATDPIQHPHPFTFAVETLRDSYHYLPLVGHAALAGYSPTGSFDPDAFFNFHEPVDGADLSVIDLIALQNAKAVLNVEHFYRQAWTDAHPH